MKKQFAFVLMIVAVSQEKAILFIPRQSRAISKQRKQDGGRDCPHDKDDGQIVHTAPPVQPRAVPVPNQIGQALLYSRSLGDRGAVQSENSLFGAPLTISLRLSFSPVKPQIHSSNLG